MLASLAISAACAFVGTADDGAYVRGYYKSDGTYVAPHYRSSPNRSYNDNWSVSPNRNPYTGRQGTSRPTLNNRSPPSSPYRRTYRKGD